MFKFFFSSGKLSFATAIIMVTTFFLNGCVFGYRNYPRHQLSKPFPTKKYDQLYYFIDGTSLAGGHLALRDAFKWHSPFENTEEREKAPKQGLYVKATIENLPFSVPTLVFGYLSYATLTILPVWSKKDGSIIRFKIYKDADLKKTFDYEVRRTGAVWIVLLPFIWVNLLTANEEKAFQAVTKEFFKEGDPYFAK